MEQTYTTGRLRINWLTELTDEFRFQDTVHGFLPWAFASLATAALPTSVIGPIFSGCIQAGTSVAGSRMERGGHG